MKATICHSCLQFLQLQEEDIASHLEGFVTIIWGLLINCGPAKGQDNLAQAAMAFLTSVCRSTHYKIFEAGDTIKQVCPNVRLVSGTAAMQARGIQLSPECGMSRFTGWFGGVPAAAHEQRKSTHMVQICEGIVIPSTRFREDDGDDFEGNWREYARRDLEGSDSETRRRAAADFVRTLVQKFPQATTATMIEFIQSLVAQCAPAYAMDLCTRL